MILLIDNYDSFTWNLVHYFGQLGAEVQVVRNDELTVAQVEQKAPRAIVLSPGPSTPNEAGICLDLIKTCAKENLPLFGVCLGMQALAEVFGATVSHAPTIMHGKTSPITHSGKGLFKDLPSPFTATRYHSLIVERESLPAELEITAEAEDCRIIWRRA